MTGIRNAGPNVMQNMIPPGGDVAAQTTTAQPVETQKPSDHLRPLDLNGDGNVTVKEAEVGLWRAGFTTLDSKLTARLAVGGVGGDQGHASHVSLEELDNNSGFHGSSAEAIKKLENLDKIFDGKPYVTEQEIKDGIHARLHAPEGDRPEGFTPDETKALVAAYGEWHFLFRAKGTHVPGVEEKVLTYETAKDMVTGKAFEPVRFNKPATEGIFGGAVDGINALREGSDLIPTIGTALVGAAKENLNYAGDVIADKFNGAVDSFRKLW